MVNSIKYPVSNLWIIWYAGGRQSQLPSANNVA